MYHSNRDLFRQAVLEKEAAFWGGNQGNWDAISKGKTPPTKAPLRQRVGRLFEGRQAKWNRIANPGANLVTRNTGAASAEAGRKAVAAAGHAPAATKAAPAAAKATTTATKAAPAAGGAATKGVSRLGAAGRFGAMAAGGAALGAGGYALGRKLFGQPKTAEVLRRRLFTQMASAPDREKRAQALFEGEEAAGEVLRRCSI